MRLIALLNAAAGNTPPEEVEGDEARLHEAFAAAGAMIEVKRVEGPHLTETAKRLANEVDVETIIGAAGGDGTQSAVAAALTGTSIPMAILPMGTLNHLSKDAGIPQDLADAARAIVTGRPHPIDVAEVNGQIFTNNASIGLY